MHQHPSTNGIPHLQLLGHQLEGRPATAIRFDGAEVSHRLGSGGVGGRGQGRWEGIGEGKGTEEGIVKW